MCSLNLKYWIHYSYQSIHWNHVKSGTVDSNGCQDANECTLGTHLCEQGGFPLTCINTDGGYECEVDPTSFQDGEIKEQWFN